VLERRFAHGKQERLPNSLQNSSNLTSTSL
jgi:hypothetical protein